MASKYATPIVLSDDSLTHVPGRAGQPVDPALIPLAPGADNLLGRTDEGLVLRAEDLISAEKNNPLAVGADDKLKVDMGVVVTPGDPILSVQDNRLKTTFSVSLGSDGVLVFKGSDGKTLDSVELPVIPGVPTAVEYLPDVAPPAGSIVIGGVVGQLGNYLHMRFRLSNGQDKDVFIDYDKIHELKPGQGISISKDHTVSVKLAPDSHLKLDDRGLAVDVAGGGGSLAAPNGGLTQSPSGQLMVDCEQMGGCISEWVGRLISAGAGLTLSNGQLSVDFSNLPADKKMLITPYLIQQGGGLVVNDAGLVGVDFSQMPTDKFEALLKQIHVPIWMTAPMVFWVDAATGSDVLDDGRGTEAKPFKTITAAVQYATANYNTVEFQSAIRVKGGTYNEAVILGAYSATSGLFSLECADIGNPPTVRVANNTYGSVYAPSTMSVEVGTLWQVVGLNIVRDYNLSVVNNPNNWWGRCFMAHGEVRFRGCHFTLNVTGSPVIGLYDLRCLYADSSAFINVGAMPSIPRGMAISSNAPGYASYSDSVRIYGLSMDSSSVVFYGDNDPAVASDALKLTFSGAYGVVQAVNLGGRIVYTENYTKNWAIQGSGVTGKKYLVQNAGTIITNGRGTSATPGSEDGEVDTATYGIFS